MSTFTPSNIKAIIFDYDLTLINSFHSAFEIYKYVEQELSSDTNITEEQLKSLWGATQAEIIRGLFGPDVDMDVVLNAILIARKTVGKDMKLFDDTLETLNVLHKKFHLGILTSATSSIVTYFSHQTGLPLELFDVIQTTDDTTVYKPDPAVFDPIIERYESQGIEKDQIVYVGDSPRDYIAARDADIHFFAVTTGLDNSEVFKSHGLDDPFILPRLQMLISIFNEV
ncbi:HAD-IA family hydrolase [Candidatus Dojkabacteria bacterium]|uniref:HAD-IA family hydrolase n=1 Tax=Candidatus Dojkabacteria bacterium TaxID=2099670 RepID=A0A955L7R5_9BACT|nr:HAD-IA family hydrolase [Candidatus Dojkabacteria bacterium]